MYVGVHVKRALLFSYVKLDFSQQLYKKKKNPQASNLLAVRPVGSVIRVIPSEQTDRRDECNSRVSQFCEIA
jgi:hypothetical protein